MYTLSTNFYCGLPIELWNNLIEETEDLFSEEEIGTHILGIYPAGKRLYGCESSSQGLLCLYFDSIDAIIDPIPRKNYHSCNIGNQNSPVTFIELHEWTRRLLNDVYSNDKRLVRSIFQDNLFHLIPSMGDNLFEDTSINSIIYYVQEMNLINYETYYFPVNTTNHDRIYNLLSARTRLIMRYYNTFIPNINKEWGEVKYLNCQEDENFIDMVLNNQNIPEVISEFNRYLNKFHFQNKTKVDGNYVDITRLNYKSNIQKEVIKLYRSLS